MSANSQRVFDAIIRATEDVLVDIDVSSITPDQSLRDLGANSLDRADIVTTAMEMLGVEVPLVSLAGAGNIGELARLLEEQLQAEGDV